VVKLTLSGGSASHPLKQIVSSSAFISEDLFASNGTYQIGIAIAAYHITVFPIYYYCVFNQDGSLFWKSPRNFYGAAFYNTSAGTKMVLSQVNSDTIQVYSLPGHYYATSIKPMGADSNHVQVYPDPAADHVFISLGNTDHDGSMQVSNIDGQVIQTLPLTPGQKLVNLDTRVLPAGVYVYSIQLKGISTAQTGKFLVGH